MFKWKLVFIVRNNNWLHPPLFDGEQLHWPVFHVQLSRTQPLPELTHFPSTAASPRIPRPLSHHRAGTHTHTHKRSYVVVSARRFASTLRHPKRANSLTETQCCPGNPECQHLIIFMFRYRVSWPQSGLNWELSKTKCHRHKTMMLPLLWSLTSFLWYSGIKCFSCFAIRFRARENVVWHLPRKLSGLKKCTFFSSVYSVKSLLCLVVSGRIYSFPENMTDRIRSFFSNHKDLSDLRARDRRRRDWLHIY